MPVTLQDPINSSTANGVATVFPYQFLIPSADAIAVEVAGVLVTTGFTVSGVGNAAGGNITFTVPPIAGASVVRYRDLDAKRDFDWSEGGDLLASTHDANDDYAIMLIQQLVEGLARAPKLRRGSSFAGLVSLPEPVAGAGLVWNALGTNLTNLIGSLNTSLVTQSGSTLARLVSAKLGSYLSILDFLTDVTGTIDQTAQVRLAVTELVARGGGALDFHNVPILVMSDELDVNPLVSLTGIDGVTFLSSGCEFRISRNYPIDTIRSILFNFTDCRNITFGDFFGSYSGDRFTGGAFPTIGMYRRGVVFAKFNGQCENVRGSNLLVENFSMGWWFNIDKPLAMSLGSRNINFGNIRAYRTGYPLEQHRSGHQITGQIFTRECGRSWICQDVWGASIRITSQDHDATTDVGLGGSVRDIDLVYQNTHSTRAVQTLVIDATGGTFTISWLGQTTAAIVHNVTSATIQAAIEALSNVAVGDISITGAFPSHTITWYNVGNLGIPTANAVLLTGGASTATLADTPLGRCVGVHFNTEDCTDMENIDVRVHVKARGGTYFDWVCGMMMAVGSVPIEIQELTINAGGGTFTYTYGANTTGALAYNIAAADLQTAINALASVIALGAGVVTVTGGPGGIGGQAPYVIKYPTTKLGVVLPSTDAGGLTGGNPTSTARVRTGTFRNVNISGIVDSLDARQRGVFIENPAQFGDATKLYGSRLRDFTMPAGGLNSWDFGGNAGGCAIERVLVGGNPSIDANKIVRLTCYRVTATEPCLAANDRHIDYAFCNFLTAANMAGAYAGKTLFATLLAGVLENHMPAGRFKIPVVLTANLPAASAAMDGAELIEDGGAGNRNKIIYAGGERFRIDGGAAF